MVLRVTFFVLMALGLVGFATITWVVLRSPPPVQVAATAQAVTPVAVAAPAAPAPKVAVAGHALAAGTLLRPEDIEGKAVDADVGKGAISAEGPDALRLLAGSMVRRAMAAGQPIRADDVMKPTDHGFMAAALQPGMRAVTIGVDASSGVAGLVWPGDRVDLILTQTLTDPLLPPGSRVAADTILSNTRVIAIDQQLMQGAAPTGGDSQARTVTLEVTGAQAQRVSVAMRLGRLSLSVRSSDVGSGDTSADGGGSVYARDVSSALGGDAPVAINKSIRVFQGAGEAKEYKY
jgi:pilus assembly protein CpaB